MLSKEQCLSEELNPQSSAIDLSNPHLRDAVFYGMQLFAKDVAVRFGKWLSENYYMDNEGFYHHDYQNKLRYTTEQLFELFLQSINQK